MQGKDTFILYKKYISPIKKLDMNQRGVLFTLILEYVNDMNPSESGDVLVDVVFDMIKSDLKYDLQKWKDTCKMRAEAGRKGGINRGKRRNFASNKKCEKNEANEAKQANEANASFAKKPLSPWEKTSDFESSQNEANEANEAEHEHDNDNEHEHDNVHDYFANTRNHVNHDMTDYLKNNNKRKCLKENNFYSILGMIEKYNFLPNLKDDREKCESIFKNVYLNLADKYDEDDILKASLRFISKYLKAYTNVDDPYGYYYQSICNIIDSKQLNS